MKRQSGGQQTNNTAALSDLDCIPLYYAGWIKAILLFLTKVGFKLSTLLRTN